MFYQTKQWMEVYICFSFPCGADDDQWVLANTTPALSGCLRSWGTHYYLALLAWSAFLPLPLSFFLFLLLSLSLYSVTAFPTLFLFLSRPDPLCWPCSVYYFLFLLCTLLDASGCSLPRIFNKYLPPNHSMEWPCHYAVKKVSWSC